MSEPKRWTVPASVCPAALGNGYPEVNVIAAEDYDRLREERDRLAEASETLAAAIYRVRWFRWGGPTR